MIVPRNRLDRDSRPPCTVRGHRIVPKRPNFHPSGERFLVLASTESAPQSSSAPPERRHTPIVTPSSPSASRKGLSLRQARESWKPHHEKPTFARRSICRHSPGFVTIFVMKATNPLRTRAGRILRKLAQLYPDAYCALNYANPLQLLVATILAAQCTDERVNQVTPALFARFPDAFAFATAEQKE